MEIASVGLKVAATRRGIISCATELSKALEFAFLGYGIVHPDQTQSRDIFLAVIVASPRSDIKTDPVYDSDLNRGVLKTAQDIAPDKLTKIFVYDPEHKFFFDIRPFLLALANNNGQ